MTPAYSTLYAMASVHMSEKGYCAAHKHDTGRCSFGRGSAATHANMHTDERVRSNVRSISVPGMESDVSTVVLPTLRPEW